ncbi:MAG: GTPase [Candidatus Hodgkinia cicadicola]
MVHTIYSVVNSTPCAIAIIRLTGTMTLKSINAITGKIIAAANSKICFIEGLDKSIGKCVIKWQPSTISPTGEDYAEIYILGLLKIIKLVLFKLSRIGLIKASKGAFAKRGLLNGKLTTTEVINIARNFGLDTNLALIKNITSDIKNIIVRLETGNYINIKTCINQLISKIVNKIKIEYRLSNTCLVGNMSVGKSSLFNAIVGGNRVMVNNIKGTTRDVIKASSKSLIIYDTPGFNLNNKSTLEIKALTNSWKYINNSGVIILVLDDVVQKKFFLRTNNKSAIIIVVSKSDLIHKLPKRNDVIYTSSYSLEGINKLRTMLRLFTKYHRPNQTTLNIIRILNECMKDDNKDDNKLNILKKLYAKLTEYNNTALASDLLEQFCIGK